MRLITQTLKSSLPAIGETDGTEAGDIVIRAKFFALGSAATWLIAEYDAEDHIVFCYADLFGQGTFGGAEWGYSSVSEMESVMFGPIPRIERDIHFTPRPFRECIDKEGRIIV